MPNLSFDMTEMFTIPGGDFRVGCSQAPHSGPFRSESSHIIGCLSWCRRNFFSTFLALSPARFYALMFDIDHSHYLTVLPHLTTPQLVCWRAFPYDVFSPLT